MSFCPSKDIHSVYLDNELPEIYKAEYEEHLKNCPQCQKELEKIRALHKMFTSDSVSITPRRLYDFLPLSDDFLEVFFANFIFICKRSKLWSK